MDIRLKLLSFSSLLTKHSCPRKFQLYRLNAEKESLDINSDQSLTFCFGHAVGTGIQYLLEGKSIEQTIWLTYLNWYCDLALENPKQNKSFYRALIALQKFEYITKAVLKDYELLYYQGKPACELSFSIELPGGYKFRGSVDAVLRHKITGKILVLECKTTSSANLNAAQYKNSAQGIGYSVVLDVIAPDISSYEVMYLPYKTKSEEFEVFTFPKSYLQRAQWIQELLLDTQEIDMYEEAGLYPMRGESCLNWNRECEYFNTCTLTTEYLVKPLTAEEEAKLLEKEEEDYQIKLTLQDLINAQLAKNTAAQEASPQISSPINSNEFLL